MTRLISVSAAIAVLAFSLLSSSAAFAAKRSEAQQQYERERAACMNGTSNQDRATCLKEASAALQEARRGNLSGGDLARNKVSRCDSVPAADREDCLMRMKGAGTSSGTARDGGIIREYKRPAN